MEVINSIVTICSAFTVVCVAVGWVVKIVAGIKKPEKDQNDRLSAIEGKIEAFETYFMRDKQRISSLERGNRVTQEAILALLSHSIDGNNTGALEKARDHLQTYLLDCGVKGAVDED